LRWKVTFKPNIEFRDFLSPIVMIEGYKQFVQNIPLPPAIRADIDRLNIVRAVRGTTGIEGSTLTEDKVREIIENKARKKAEKLSLEEQEAVNADDVLEYIRSREPERRIKLTEGFVRQVHRITTKDCKYEGNVPGEYRDHNVRAGEYSCPSHMEVPALMKEFISFINSEPVIETHAVIRAILAHFYLVSIHPFGDGNGRTSRGVEAYILYNGGYYNALGFYSLANFYYRNRGAYVEQLQKARFQYDGNLTAFVKFSLNGFVEELEDIRNQVLDFYREISYCDYINELHSSGEINDRIHSILLWMAKKGESMSTKEFRERKIPLIAAIYKNLSNRTVRSDLKRMTDLDLIRIEDDIVSANIALMDEFAPVHL